MFKDLLLQYASRFGQVKVSKKVLANNIGEFQMTLPAVVQTILFTTN
jgi:hypothetical protein